MRAFHTRTSTAAPSPFPPPTPPLSPPSCPASLLPSSPRSPPSQHVTLTSMNPQPPLPSPSMTSIAWSRPCHYSSTRSCFLLPSLHPCHSSSLLFAGSGDAASLDPVAPGPITLLPPRRPSHSMPSCRVSFPLDLISISPLLDLVSFASTAHVPASAQVTLASSPSPAYLATSTQLRPTRGWGLVVARKAKGTGKGDVPSLSLYFSFILC